MKKIFLLLISSLILAACNNNQDENRMVEFMSDKELYSFFHSEDEVVDATFKDGELKIVLKLAEGKDFSLHELPPIEFERVSKELFKYDEWDKLTIEFQDIAIASANRSQAEKAKSEYFPKHLIRDEFIVYY